MRTIYTPNPKLDAIFNHVKDRKRLCATLFPKPVHQPMQIVLQ